jgi:hypothetical protein
VVLIVAALLAVIVFVPQLAIDPHGLTRDQWLSHVQDLRTTILQGLGGLAVVAGAVVAALNLRETNRQNRVVHEQNRAVLEHQRRGQAAERYTRAIDQLSQQGPEKLDIRMGAVYALEQIARDSADLHWPIMEVLTTYLREHAPFGAPADAAAGEPRPERLPADHQAIATVIGRRDRRQDPDVEGERLDLSRADLGGVRWGGAHLEKVVLEEAHLEGAFLVGTHLEGACLYGAHLGGAYLYGAHLEGAHLFEVDLKQAYLSFEQDGPDAGC